MSSVIDDLESIAEQELGIVQYFSNPATKYCSKFGEWEQIDAFKKGWRKSRELLYKKLYLDQSPAFHDEKGKLVVRVEDLLTYMKFLETGEIK